MVRPQNDLTGQTSMRLTLGNRSADIPVIRVRHAGCVGSSDGDELLGIRVFAAKASPAKQAIGAMRCPEAFQDGMVPQSRVRVFWIPPWPMPHAPLA
jgi:hypothetical protein